MRRVYGHQGIGRARAAGGGVKLPGAGDAAPVTEGTAERTTDQAVTS